MKDKIKALPEKYNYYTSIKHKSEILSRKIFKNKNSEIYKTQLFNLMLNICNQAIYGYTYSFNKQDIFFIIDNGININEIINLCKIDILKNKKA